MYNRKIMPAHQYFFVFKTVTLILTKLGAGSLHWKLPCRLLLVHYNLCFKWDLTKLNHYMNPYNVIYLLLISHVINRFVLSGNENYWGVQNLKDHIGKWMSRITVLNKEQKLWSFLSCNFLPLPISSSHLGSHILISNLSICEYERPCFYIWMEQEIFTLLCFF